MVEISTDNFGDAPSTTLLLTAAGYSSSAIAHFVNLSAADSTVCLALQTEALVIRHDNQPLAPGDPI